MTAPFSKIVNSKHDNMVLIEKQNQAIELANSRRVNPPAKKNHAIVMDIILALVFVAAVAVAFYMTTAEHRGDPSINGVPISEMSISEQIEGVKEARYND